MDPYESHYERKLIAKFDEARKLKVNALVGGALSVDEMHRAIGYIQALDKFYEWSKQARREVYGSPDDDNDDETA